MTRQTNASILFVDDDINILLSLKRLVYDMNLEVHTAITAEEGLDILRKVTLILLSQIKVCQALMVMNSWEKLLLNSPTP